MEDRSSTRWQRSGGIVLAVLAIAIMTAAAASAQVSVNVVGVSPDGTETPLSAYRWVLEEDRTFHVSPGARQVPTLSIGFHSSYMPVVASGDETTPFPSLRAGTTYFLSVLPKVGPAGKFSIGGAPIAPGQSSVTVYVNQNPLPTAQIRIQAFEDKAPLNGAWDFGEPPLEGFSVVLEDAGGRYGISAGMQMTDAFGNPLGTTYRFIDSNGNGVHDTGETYVAGPDGQPIVLEIGAGIVTAADGTATIRNLSPGKYGISIVPPAGQEWQQTSTIEGTKVIDAWVKANEPPYFAEFGPPGPHVAIGFTREFVDATVLNGGSTIEGQVVNLHLSRPPEYAFYDGAPFVHTRPWVGLNLGAGGTARTVFVTRCQEDGSFSIPNVPEGSYQLVVFDDALDLIIGFKGVTVNADGSCNMLNGCNLGDVPAFQWFTRTEHWVFNDVNENGFRDPGERGIPEQAINIRWRDGTVYQSFPTDGEGFVPFDQTFPFFAWQVAEVDFARFKATGVTITTDNGGPIDATDPWTWGGQLKAQAQGNPPDPASAVVTDRYRTERGPVLTEAFQGFIGQTSVFEWGKTAYGPGENGGISGIVYYATTRAEDNPELAAAEPWEPGIPRVTVNLYSADGTTLLNTTTTDSWDDSLPENCQHGTLSDGATPGEPFIFRGYTTDCYDGLRNFNQVRPGVFDGGYAFDAYCADRGGMGPGGSCGNMVDGIPPGSYVVEVVPPPGYEIIRSQDRNVDFGDDYFPSPLLLPAPCVGTPYRVPAELALFPGVEAPMAGQTLNLCDKKLVALNDGANAAADFFLFTETPIAGHIIGFILDDTANEFDPNSPNFGEKFAPAWLPVSIRDWTGREIARTYSDEFGVYNALVPSTFTANRPAPSGMSPNMITTCMNARTLPDGTPDPFHNPQYSQFCYTLQYMPGTTTYLDTPVVPVAAFAGANPFPLDCELGDGTPEIFSASVANSVGGGPYAEVDNRGRILSGPITLTSMGMVPVPNPAYQGVGGPQPKTIPRDYGFGCRTAVPSLSISGIPLTDVACGFDGRGRETVTATIPDGTPTGQLIVTRGDNGRSSTTGITVQMGLRQGASVRTVSAGQSIQQVIDAAGANDLILVGPGNYNEMLIMWKPVQLQGWGLGTVLSAVKTPAEKLQAWRDHVVALITNGDVDLLPGQETNLIGGIEPNILFNEEGAGVLVLAKETGSNRFSHPKNRGARIDGFEITGADTGGGIVVNGFGPYLEISNNKIMNNSGWFGGGIRLGHPTLVAEQGNGLIYPNAGNRAVSIHNNQISENGGQAGAGGGVTLGPGSDGYQLRENFICGNFTLADGAGVAHYGLSLDGTIVGNTILFNENFNQGSTVSGGGILISGQPPFGCPIDPRTGQPDPACLADPERALSPGAGTVSIIGNTIKGNASGAGDGGGIRLARVNGQDVVSGRGKPETYTVDIFNNMIVDNVAGLAGGGISLQDAVAVRIINNTIANNDSTGTAGEAFPPGVPDTSNPQPGAGIASRAHSAELASFLPGGDPGFSDPEMANNIVWHNRQFYFTGTGATPDPATGALNFGLCPDLGGGFETPPAGCGTDPVYDDMAVLGVGGASLTCTQCLTDELADPAFIRPYVNGNRKQTIIQPEFTTAIQTPAAFDEGGNFIRLRFGPLTETIEINGRFVLRGDYHLGAGSEALDMGIDLTDAIPALAVDFDGDLRPAEGTAVDIGADETVPDDPGPKRGRAGSSSRRVGVSR